MSSDATVLFGYWRSSAAYRVRIALNLKGIDYQQQSVHLLNNGGEQHSANFSRMNPNELVPVLSIDGCVLHQSTAIIEYLEETRKKVSLLPEPASQRALVRALSHDIATDIHPINNLRVLQYLADTFEITDGQKSEWVQHWIAKGFTALEQRLQSFSGRYCFGDNVTLADVCLVPQVYNAKRFGVDMLPYPRMEAVVKNLNQLTAFQQAEPENQPDAQ